MSGNTSKKKKAKRAARKSMSSCPLCGKKVKGLKDHMRGAHNSKIVQVPVSVDAGGVIIEAHRKVVGI